MGRGGSVEQIFVIKPEDKLNKTGTSGKVHLYRNIFDLIANLFDIGKLARVIIVV